MSKEAPAKPAEKKPLHKLDLSVDALRNLERLSLTPDWYKGDPKSAKHFRHVVDRLLDCPEEPAPPTREGLGRDLTPKDKKEWEKTVRGYNNHMVGSIVLEEAERDALKKCLKFHLDAGSISYTDGINLLVEQLGVLA